MSGHILKRLLLAGSALLLFVACEAPRHNPFDPGNPDSPFASLSGAVKSVALPSTPLANVKVTWENSHEFAVTNARGEFSFADIQPVDGWLYFAQDGYFADSSYITWNNQKSATADMVLNARPAMGDLDIHSIVLNRYPSFQSFQLFIKAGITDIDNDIDSVYVAATDAGVRAALRYNVDEKAYERTFNVYDLNVRSMDEIVGHRFEIMVKDKFSHLICVGEGDLARVIHNEIEFDSPSGYELVPASPRFRWNTFNPGFAFTFEIEIFTDEISPQKVWQKSGVPADSTSYTVDRLLPPNDYFWVIWCVDEFNNRSRSKPASFSIQ